MGSNIKIFSKKYSLLIELVPSVIWGIVIVNIFVEKNIVYTIGAIGGVYFLWSNIVAYFTDGVMANSTHRFDPGGDRENQKDRKWFARSCMIMLPLWIIECLYYAGVFD